MYSNRGYQLHAPPLSPINKFLIIALVALFLIQSVINVYGGPSLIKYLGLSAHMVMNGYLYQIVTYPFIQSGFFALLFECLLLWFIGGELEYMWGQRRYLTYLLVSVFGGGISYLLVTLIFLQDSMIFSLPLIGPGGITLSLLVAYGLLFSERYLSFMLIFPIKAKYFCLLIGGIELYMGLFSPYGKSAWGHLGAMGFSFLFLRGMSIWQSLRMVLGKKTKKKNPRKFYLIKTEEQEKDKKKKKNEPKYWQ